MFGIRYVPKIADEVGMSVVFGRQDIHISFSLLDELHVNILVSFQSNGYWPIEKTLVKVGGGRIPRRSAFERSVLEISNLGSDRQLRLNSGRIGNGQCILISIKEYWYKRLNKHDLGNNITYWCWSIWGDQWCFVIIQLKSIWFTVHSIYSTKNFG